MNYIIINNSTLQEFEAKVKEWYSKGLYFSVNYIEKVTDPSMDVPGGWGCLHFTCPLPSSVLFTSPDVEYRYSEEQNAWLANGELTPYSDIVAGLYTYFASLDGEK